MNLAHNPDGHSACHWVNAPAAAIDPWAVEQQREQPWGIGGRTNHYQVDLNRDALAMSQVESRQIAQAFRRWRPQVFVDHHGQTATYLFAPPANPINADLSSHEVEKWTEIFGRANAAAFDRYGWNYFVRDVFDLYYPGYWDSWPTLNGAVGMTYETDGGGNLAIRRDDETVVTLLDGIQRHFTASLATAAAAGSHREERLRDYTRFAQSAIDAGRTGPVRAYAFECGDDPLKAAALAENLLNAGVEVQWLEKGFRSAARATGGGTRPRRRRPPPSATKGRRTPKTRRAAEQAAGERPPARGGMADYPEAGGARVEGPGVRDRPRAAGGGSRTLLERSAPVDSAFARIQLDVRAQHQARSERRKGLRLLRHHLAGPARDVRHSTPTRATPVEACGTRAARSQRRRCRDRSTADSAAVGFRSRPQSRVGPPSCTPQVMRRARLPRPHRRGKKRHGLRVVVRRRRLARLALRLMDGFGSRRRPSPCARAA